MSLNGLAYVMKILAVFHVIKLSKGEMGCSGMIFTPTLKKNPPFCSKFVNGGQIHRLILAHTDIIVP
jgi:hypothetical protein